MVTIRKQLISDTSMKFGRSNPKRYLTIHETANTGRGANAAAHANLQSRMWDWATWHWTVDDREAVQSYTHDFQLWHAGDGTGNGNMQSIAIEACVNSDGNMTKMRQNLVELAGKIVADENIPKSRIVQHNYWSGKNCPAIIRRDGSWSNLVNRIWAEAERIRGKKPAPKPTPTPIKPFTGDAKAFVGKTVTIGEWWNYRTAKDAEKLVNPGRIMPAGSYRVTQVSGNTPHLVKTDNTASGWVHSSVLATQKAPAPASKKKSTNQVAKEVIDGKWGNGQDRVNRLTKAGYNPVTIQAEVNRRLGFA